MRVFLQLASNRKNKKQFWQLPSNHIHSILACFPYLLDESCASEIWELLASSSHSGDVCCFVGVKGSRRSGSWSAVLDRDCCIKDRPITDLNSKIDIDEVLKCDSGNKY